MYDFLLALFPALLILAAIISFIPYWDAPDASQAWIRIAPRSILATTLWLATTLAFTFDVGRAASCNATYGVIGGVILLMLLFYLTALAVLVGAELNAEIEHAPPYGKNPGDHAAGAQKAVAPVS